MRLDFVFALDCVFSSCVFSHCCFRQCLLHHLSSGHPYFFVFFLFFASSVNSLSCRSLKPYLRRGLEAYKVLLSKSSRVVPFSSGVHESLYPLWDLRVVFAPVAGLRSCFVLCIMLLSSNVLRPILVALKWWIKFSVYDQEALVEDLPTVVDPFALVSSSLSHGLGLSPSDGSLL